MGRGIDYGRGTTNTDLATGIRFGIICQNELCGDSVNDICMNGTDVSNLNAVAEEKNKIRSRLENEETHSEEQIKELIEEIYEDEFPNGVDCCESGPWFYEQDGYEISLNGSYISVLKSDFYTFVEFCTACFPGAGNLSDYCSNGPKTYCLEEKWFSENQPCPYPIYRVDNDELVFKPEGFDENED